MKTINNASQSNELGHKLHN